MAVRELLLKLGLRSWERARDLGQSVQVSVKKSVDLSREARREIGAAVRERTAQAKLLASDAASGGTLSERAARLASAQDPRIQAAVDQAIAKLGTFQGIIGLGRLAAKLPTERGLEATLDVASAVARIGGPYGQIVATVLEMTKGLIAKHDQEIAKQIDDRIEIDRKIRAQELLTFEERIKKDPVLATQESRRVYEAFLSQRAALSDSGLSPAQEHIDWGD